MGLLFTLLIAGALGQAGDEACTYDPATYLALDFHAFDQTEEGWRGPASQNCLLEAAELIGRYREVHADTLGPNEAQGLVWHEAQMLAAGDQYEPALVLFRTTYPQDDASQVQWFYVEATVAFLERDRDRLEAARAGLVALPEPEYFTDAVARFRVSYPDHEPPVWPLNLSVVDRFIACFDHPYRVAYGGSCDAAGD